MAPVVAGYWRQYETWNGRYNLDDLLDIYEVMAVQYENQERAREAADARRNGEGGRLT